MAPLSLTRERRACAADYGRRSPSSIRALAQAEQANDELRELAHGILPGVLDRGLAAGVEALTNVAKHAQARTALVTASVDDGDLQIALADDGVGGARPDGRGLIGLRDRVAALGGRLRIDSPPGGGTRITASLPLDRRR
jgi:signal transduction histidine kinase